MIDALLSQLNFYFIFVWGIALIRSILFWNYFVQLKQYRPDRLKLAFKHNEFSQLYLNWYRLALFIMLVGIELSARVSSLQKFYDIWFVLTALAFTLYALLSIYNAFKGKIKLPEFTFKMIGLIVLALVFNIGIAYLYQFLPSQLLALELLQPFIIFAIFFAFYGFNKLLQSNTKAKALKLREQLPNLKVIGITGSFGKTTTKEYLKYLLSSKYKVLATPSHMNVDIGIANFMLKNLKPEHEIFIVEMGAYKMGEIKNICDLVQPDYAVMTGISNQHLELFGSQENIVKAKFELVNCAKTVIANQDSEILKEELSKLSIDTIWFGYKKYNGVFGKANNTNLSGAIACAELFDVNVNDDLLKDLPVVSETMEVCQNSDGSVTINDTYNANTEGVLTALDDLNEFEQTKIVVFKNVIELGDNSKDDHIKIAKKLNEVADHILLMPSAEKDVMLEHIDKSKLIETEQLSDLRKSAVTLFEGKETKKYL